EVMLAGPAGFEAHRAQGGRKKVDRGFYAHCVSSLVTGAAIRRRSICRSVALSKTRRYTFFFSFGEASRINTEKALSSVARFFRSDQIMSFMTLVISSTTRLAGR